VGNKPAEDSNVINAEDLSGLYTDACPSFTQTWAEIAKDPIHVDEAGARRHYLDAGEFVRHIAGLEVAGRREEFPAVFQMIEDLVTNGDSYVSNLAVIGILEGFQMASVTDLGVDPELAFRPLIGPSSEHWWARINRFWDGDHTALHDGS